MPDSSSNFSSVTSGGAFGGSLQVSRPNFCSHCGLKIESMWNYCAGCGRVIAVVTSSSYVTWTCVVPNLQASMPNLQTSLVSETLPLTPL
jgi:hypothetical protein